MKVYQTNEIKNIALLGNDGSGKTTLTEALLFESGIITVSYTHLTLPTILLV